VEAAPAIGGLASAWQLGDVVWDRHYHVTLLSDSSTRRLLAELRLEQDMRWVETKTGYYSDGVLSSVSDTTEFLRLPGLSPVAKARLAATILAAAQMRNWKQLEQVPVSEWLIRWSGRKTYERFWLPLLRAKLGDSAHDTSAAFIWATIQRLYAARRTGLKKELFGYVPGGYARILRRFAEVLRAEGVELALGRGVRSVTRDGDELLVDVDGEAIRADEVVVTANPRVAARICTDLTASERDRLERVRYQGIVCASLLLRRPLSPYYLTYITDDVPFTAVIEMSALVDRAELAGNALIYLPKYVDPDDPFLAASDDEVRVRFLSALGRLYPRFRATDIIAFEISRVREVFPVPVLHYSEDVPPMPTSVPGLHIVNSAQIVNGTLNVNETIQLAERSARRLVARGEWERHRALVPGVAA
jgi:protoporphyrinogen oxidase